MNSEKVFNAHLGFFSNPVYFGNNKVLKNYRLNLSETSALKLKSMHDYCVNRLKSIGIRIPETEARLTSKGNRFSLEIIQDRFNPNELAGEIIKNGSLDSVLHTVSSVVKDSLTFLKSNSSDEIGFHPSLRNYVIRDGLPYYIDTFPPLVKESEVKNIILMAAPNLKSKAAAFLLYPFMQMYTRECYSAPEMIRGIVGTATRLRQQYLCDIQDRVTSLVSESDLHNKDKILDSVSEVCQNNSQNVKWKFAHSLYRM